MASTFAGLSIADRGLTASQIGLTTTTNNQSNVDTKGYSRQVLNQTSIGPAAVYSSNLVGSGTEVTSVDRVRSDRLDEKYWQENSASSACDAKSSYLSQIEAVFGSTSTNSISKSLDTFNTDLEKISTSPSDTSVRATLLTDAESLCSTLNSTATELTQLRSDVNSDVKTTVTKINSDTTQIAELNKKISVAKSSGASTNELEDQRGLLVDDLSGLIGITTTKSDNGVLTITTADGSAALVSDNTSKQLECYTITDTTSAQNGMYGIRDAKTKQDVKVGDSGTLGGDLQARDGNSSDNKGIPYYIQQLDTFTQTFAKAMNEGTAVGTTSYNGNADGVGLNDTKDTRLFSYDDKSSADLMKSGTDTDAVYKNITAANITVSKDVQEDTNKIAASSTTGDDNNNTNAKDLISISNKANIFGTTTATGFLSSLIGDIGSASAAAKTEYTQKSTFTSYINTSRSSVSTVSTNEETVNLTKYQKAYEASASMVTTWGKIYDTTIDMVNT